jgi:hypothetical protein
MDGYSGKSYAISADKGKSRPNVDKQLGIADDPDPTYLARTLSFQQLEEHNGNDLGVLKFRPSIFKGSGIILSMSGPFRF